MPPVDTERSRLAESFLQYFDVACVVTDEQKRAVFKTRYNVYCDEFGYEPAERFPDQEERDEFDDASVHALVTHRASGMPAGCVRVVAPSGVDGPEVLPLEKFCSESLDQQFIDNLGLDRNTVCEISRLAVDGAFRRRASENKTRYGGGMHLDLSKTEARTFPLISVACFLAATAITELTARTNVFAMMEPFLPRMLKRSGIVFQSAGQEIDYHGVRAPYYITTQSALDGMIDAQRELYTEIHRQVRPDFFKTQ